MTAVAKLLPCPFCGEPGEFAGCEQDGHYVRCSGRGCYGEVGENYDGCAMPSHMFSSQEDAAAQWNRRAALSPAELGGVEAVAQIELNGLSMSGLVYTKHGLESSLSDGTKLYTQAALNAEYTRGRCDGFDAALSTPRAAQAVTDEAVYTEEEVAEAMEVLRGRHGSSALVDEVLDDMERVLRAALTPPSAKGEL